jgi:hypothetical protein
LSKWQLQVTNEIVRQLLEQNGFYSTEKPIGDMKYIVDCNYIGAMNTPGGGKNDIPHRLKRQFNLYYVPLPSKASINNVYGALVEGRFTTELFDADTIDLSQRLVPMTISLWNKVQVSSTELNAVPARKGVNHTLLLQASCVLCVLEHCLQHSRSATVTHSSCAAIETLSEPTP